MSAALTVVGLVVFAAGLTATFAWSEPRGRVPGLAATAVGALLVLVTAGPTDAGTWAMAVTGGATLAGLVAVARALAVRASRAAPGGRASLDEEDG